MPRVFHMGPAMPVEALATMLSLPMAYGLYRKGIARTVQHDEFAALDGKTAQFNILFGGLLVLGFLAAALF